MQNADSVNPRALIGGNKPPEASVSPEERAAARKFAQRYNFAKMQRRAATERVKETRKEIQTANADKFAEAREARAAAREMLAGLLLSNEEYAKAAGDRKAASADMRAVLKEAEEAGVDPDALKAAVALGELDSFERADRWDKIDAYAAAMMLWIQPEI